MNFFKREVVLNGSGKCWGSITFAAIQHARCMKMSQLSTYQSTPASQSVRLHGRLDQVKFMCDYD